MKRALILILFAAIAFAPVVPLAAQDLELPEYTTEQRWQRLGFLTVGWQSALVALGESRGMSPEEVGEWAGEFFSSSWIGGGEASQLVWSMNRNHIAMPGATVEVVATTPTSATARFNHVTDEFLDAGSQRMGVSGEAIKTMLRSIDDYIAEWGGRDVDRTIGEGFDEVTFTTLYGDMRASDQLRWARGSYLSWLTSLQLISLQMRDGMTAAEIGASQAELYASSWTAPTPWRFFRGMTWNGMSDPDQDCEVLEASPEKVRGRCRLHYREVVEQNEERFGVTVQDVFDLGRTFGEGVGDYLGLVWTETLDGDWRHITVTRK